MSYEQARLTCLAILRVKTRYGKAGRAQELLDHISQDCKEDANALDQYREIYGDEFADALDYLIN